MELHIDLDKYPYKTIELQFLDGTRSIKRLTWCRVYCLYEYSRKYFSFDGKFPYIHIRRKSYISFRYADSWNTMTDSFTDSRYKVDCSLSMFMNMMGVDYLSWNENYLKSSITGRI